MTLKNNCLSIKIITIMSLTFFLIQSCKKKNFDESQTSLESITSDDSIAGKMLKRYGMLPYKNEFRVNDEVQKPYMFEWEEYAKCMPQGAKDIFTQASQNLKLRNATFTMNKYDLFTVIMGEGLGWQFDSHPKDLLTAAVDGYGVLGVDFFIADLQNMKNQGLLSSDFVEGNAFSVKEVTRNEPGDFGKPIQLKVPIFKNFSYGVRGMAAYYAKNINLFLKETSTIPSKDQLLYWGYFNYQNPVMALKWLRREGASIVKGSSAWTKSQSPEGRPAGIPAKSLKRVSTARYLEENRFLENDVVCDNPFFK